MQGYPHPQTPVEPPSLVLEISGFVLMQVGKNFLEGMLSIPTPPNPEPGMKKDGGQRGSCC